MPLSQAQTKVRKISGVIAPETGLRVPRRRGVGGHPPPRTKGATPARITSSGII